jgi:hypothetical protein
LNDDAKYREFEEALTDVLAEKEYILKRRSRLATARELVDRTDPRYLEAVERAFSARDQAAKLNSGGEPDVIGW